MQAAPCARRRDRDDRPAGDAALFEEGAGGLLVSSRMIWPAVAAPQNQKLYAGGMMNEERIMIKNNGQKNEVPRMKE